MKEVEKLRVLLPHWIEHNNGHESECLKWAEIAKKDGMASVAGHITAAVKMMKEANELLEKALHEAGGPSSEHHHHHH
jgi:ribosomal protein S17E